MDAQPTIAQQYQALYKCSYTSKVITDPNGFYNLVKKACGTNKVGPNVAAQTTLTSIIGAHALEYGTDRTYKISVTNNHPASYISRNTCLHYKGKQRIIGNMPSGHDGFVKRHNKYIDAIKKLYSFGCPLTADMARVTCKRDDTQTLPNNISSSQYEPLPSLLDAQFKHPGWTMNLQKEADEHDNQKNKVTYLRCFQPPKNGNTQAMRKLCNTNQISFEALIIAKAKVEGGQQWTMNQSPTFEKLWGDKMGKIKSIPNDELNDNDYLIGLPPEQSDKLPSNKRIGALVQSSKKDILEARRVGNESDKMDELLKKIRSSVPDKFTRFLRPEVSANGVVTKWNDIGDNNLQNFLKYLINRDGIIQQSSDFITGGLALSNCFSIMDACKDASNDLGHQNNRAGEFISQLQQESTFSNMSTTESLIELGGLVYTSTRSKVGNAGEQNEIKGHGLIHIGQQQQEMVKKKKTSKKKKKAPPAIPIDLSVGKKPPPNEEAPSGKKKKKKKKPEVTPATKKKTSKKAPPEEKAPSENRKKKGKPKVTPATKKKRKNDLDNVDFDEIDSGSSESGSEEESPPKKRAAKRKAPAKKKASRRDNSDDDFDIGIMGQSQTTSAKPSRSHTARATTKKPKYNYSDEEEDNDSEEEDAPKQPARGKKRRST